MGKKKNKYNFERRRAIKCKYIEKSKTSPGYLKYEVTICEKDGDNYLLCRYYNQRQMLNKTFYFFQNVDYSARIYVYKIHISNHYDERFQIKYIYL